MAPEWHGPETREAFWSAVLQHEVCVLVALAYPQSGFQGCADYCENGAVYGSIRVEVVSKRAALDDCAVEQHIRLHKEGKEHSLTRIMFHEWPNYGVPGAASSVAALIARIDELRADSHQQGARQGDEEEPPLLVHCAGGVGRTGSLITAHSLWAEAQATGTTSVGPEEVCARVEVLRDQRHPYCVESAQQLQLIFEVLLELDAASCHAQADGESGKKKEKS